MYIVFGGIYIQDSNATHVDTVADRAHSISCYSQHYGSLSLTDTIMLSVRYGFWHFGVFGSLIIMILYCRRLARVDDTIPE